MMMVTAADIYEGLNHVSDTVLSALHDFTTNPQKSPLRQILLLSLLQIRKLRHREVK